MQKASDVVKRAIKTSSVQRACECKGMGGTMTENITQQVENRRDGTEWVVSPPDEVHPTLSGDLIIPLTKTLYAPTPQEIRGMLFELRRRQNGHRALRRLSLV